MSSDETTPQDPEEGKRPDADAPASPPAVPSKRATPDGLDDITDETRALVQRAQSGDDPEALNELFTRYHQTMVDLARRRLGGRLRSKEDPIDLAQTTFREATRDFDNYTYRGEGSLLRWLIQILQNKIRDRAEFYSAGKRDASKERSMEVPMGPDGETARIEPPDDDLTVTMQVQRKEDYELLRRALTELSDDHREAITLVFFQGLSLRQAGEQMEGRSEDAVRMLLRRAEARLRDLLKSSEGGGSEPS
jgi:RNA polymerase sigma-70 factor (subfamily 1)